jgi:hypothetical protein
MSSPANDLTVDIYLPLLSKDSEHENEGKRIKSFAFDCDSQYSSTIIFITEQHRLEHTTS